MQKSFSGVNHSLFNKGAEVSGYSKEGEGKTLDLSLTHYIKINSKWITSLSAKHETMKLLVKKI